VTKIDYPIWQFLFLKALLAPLDSPQLSQLVTQAETAIGQRLQELPVSPIGNEERQTIEDAKHSLRMLRDQKIGRSEPIRLPARTGFPSASSLQ
jgi:hypothetical protein